MAEPKQEKRAARRFALRIPVTVNRREAPESAEAAEIRDVSARGSASTLIPPWNLALKSALL